MTTLDTKLQLRNALLNKATANAKEDFLAYVKLMAPILIPNFLMGSHIVVLCERLQKVEQGKIKRLMVMLPPRSTKSVICSKLFPAWYMGRHPSHEIMCISHKDDLAEEFGRTVRNQVASDEYRQIFPNVDLRQDSKAAGRWNTNKNGAYCANGIKSKIAGRGAHLAVLDDAGSEDLAESEAGRKFCKDWYRGDFRTRLMPGGAIVYVGTRFHDDDLQGWLLNQKVEGGLKWDVIKVPAWLDEESAALLGHPVGTSYFPEWKPDHLLKIDQAEVTADDGEAFWNALYMQNPNAEGGNIFKTEWLQKWDRKDAPNCAYIFQTIDAAESEEADADFSVIQTWGVFELPTEDHRGREIWEKNLIILGQQKGKWSFFDLIEKATVEYEKYKPAVVVIEKKSVGGPLIQALKMANIPVKEFIPIKSKILRARAATPIYETMCVWFPVKPWVEELKNDLLKFPRLKNDDVVDCAVLAALFVRDLGEIDLPTDHEWEEDENRVRRGRKTYWGKTVGNFR